MTGRVWHGLANLETAGLRQKPNKNGGFNPLGQGEFGLQILKSGLSLKK